MTKDNNVDNPVEEERPFHVVLVDLKKAAKKEIHCVEKPLMGANDLKFVAISYRWGECQETTVDTGIGYLSTITSFHLRDFFTLCYGMTMEPDLKDLQYVWVDALCVDQSSYERRKATIYQMTNIYERANYILAVPDLHLDYLRRSNTNISNIIRFTECNASYIYYIIAGDTDQLVEEDQTFIDKINVPEDPHLRHMLTKYTDHFAKGFMQPTLHDDGYDEKTALDHICETNSASRKTSRNHYGNIIRKKLLLGMSADNTVDGLGMLDANKFHTCDSVNHCPFTLFDYAGLISIDTMREKGKREWKHLITERSEHIRQSINFLADLIVDWSTRVWVISEYHIAKKKKTNKMKYWFIQLESDYGTDHRRFFEFDFSGAQVVKLLRGFSSDIAFNQVVFNWNAVYQVYHSTMQHQLSQQTFLEMILKSKASKNEDRFHAILPLTSEYKNRISSKDRVADWQIDTLVSVKLQLYDWMSTKHKLELLFLSGCENQYQSPIPTFATSSITWPEPHHYPTFAKDDGNRRCNFDLTNDFTIKLIRQDDVDNSYKLNLKPRIYYQYKFGIQLSNMDDSTKSILRKSLQLDNHDVINTICIPHTTDDANAVFVNGHKHNMIYLVGSSTKNKWVLAVDHGSPKITESDDDWELREPRYYHIGLDIY